MQNVSLGDILDEMSKPVFWEKYKYHWYFSQKTGFDIWITISLLSAEFTQ